MKKFLHVFPLLAFAAIALVSCTFVTSTNLPGKKAEKIPKNLIGKYMLEYPDALAALAGETSTIVTLKADRIIVENMDGTSETMLGDSLYYSQIGEQGYITLGEAPDFNVFKVVKSGKDIHLYSMCSENYSAITDFQQYFSHIREIPGEPDEYGDATPSSYAVTIDDKKLDDYYKSDIPMKDPFKLVYRKN